MRSHWGYRNLLLWTVVTMLIPIGVLPAAAQRSSNNARSQLTKRIVGDYGYWSKYQTPPYGAKQIPYKKLTHINHFGVSFGSDARLSVPDGFLEPELIRNAHKAGVKVLLGIGGDFPALDGIRISQPLSLEICGTSSAKTDTTGSISTGSIPPPTKPTLFTVLYRTCATHLHRRLM